MSDQPTALRLADALDRANKQTDPDDDVIHVSRWFVEDAAEELRLLHGHKIASNTWHDKTKWVQATARPSELGMHRADVMTARIKELEEQRDALLDTLKEAADALEIASDGGGVNFYQYAKEARAAIAKAEGQP